MTKSYSHYPLLNMLVIFVFGFISFATAEELWLTFFKFSSSKWVLEPTLGVAICLAIIFIFSLLASRLYSTKIGKVGPLFFSAGLIFSIIYYLFKIGEGNLWPIVILTNSVITIPFVYAGWNIPKAYNFKKSLLRYSTGEVIKAGDNVKILDNLPGVIAFCKTNEEFSPDYPREEWNYVKAGIMIATEEKGLIHLEDHLHEVEFIRRKK